MKSKRNFYSGLIRPRQHKNSQKQSTLSELALKYQLPQPNAMHVSIDKRDV